MAEPRNAPEVIEGSVGEHPVMRVDDVLLSRGDRGTWLIDLKIPWKGGYRSLQIPIGKHRAIDRLAWDLRSSDESS